MILVTGATGLLGRAVVCRLASLGHDVVAMGGTSKPQTGACHLESPCVADYGRPLAFCLLHLVCASNAEGRYCQVSEGRHCPLRAENQRAFEISFLEQCPVVRQVA
jgi:NAD(P)-dependent dehydrogenase (short-subunit alcohol dehydrogenase family)